MVLLTGAKGDILLGSEPLAEAKAQFLKASG
jgi:hypothetical protein